MHTGPRSCASPRDDAAPTPGADGQWESVPVSPLPNPRALAPSMAPLLRVGHAASAHRPKHRSRTPPPPPPLRTVSRSFTQPQNLCVCVTGTRSFSLGRMRAWSRARVINVEQGKVCQGLPALAARP